MLCYQPEFLRLVPCYQHLSTMSKGKVKSSQRSEMFFREKNTNGNFHEEIATPWLTQGQDVCTWNLFVVRSSLQFLAFELQCHGVTWSRRWWPEVMQLSRNDLRRSLCACRATSCDTVKRALCAFVQHKGKEIKRKSQKRTPKGFSKAFELFVVSENFETTRVRNNNELSGERQNHSCFFWDFDPHSSHGLSGLKLTARKLQASPGGSCASATAVCPGIFSPSAGKSLEASGARSGRFRCFFCLFEHQKTHQKTHPNAS